MPRYREIYRLSVTCTFLDRPPQTSLRSYFFLPVFVTRILPRTSIRRTAPQHQILFPPWKAFPQSRVLNRVQFPPNRDFSKITRRRRPRRNEGGGGKEREREREKGTTGTLFTSYGGNSELGHVRPVESLELYVLLVSLLIALPRRNSETFLLWAACTERFCVNEFQRGKVRDVARYEFHEDGGVVSFRNR